MSSDAMNLPILLTYHHVSNKTGLVTLSPHTFHAQMRWLAESGWKTVTAAEVESFYLGGKLPRKSVILTERESSGWLKRRLFCYTTPIFSSLLVLHKGPRLSWS